MRGGVAVHYREASDRLGEAVMIAGRYRLCEPVGSGGMGRVWLARDEMLHRDVAMKEVVPPDWLDAADREKIRERTLREARTAARLSHPHVVQVYDIVHSEEWPWIVMEYVPARSLQQVIEQDGPLPPRRVAQIGLAVLDALRTAHQAGVLHRDIKPHNLLVGDDGRVVLTDFGLATFERGDGAITHAGLVMGSPQYIAPERARDGVSSRQADMWSLGATLYAAVEGQSPYARASTMETLTALATQPPDPAVRAGPLKSALDGLLRKDPQQRLGAAEVEALLRRAALSDAAESRPNRAWTWPRPRRRRALLGAAALGVVAAVGVGAAAALRTEDPASQPSSAASGATAATPKTSTAGGVRACDAPDAAPTAGQTLTPIAPEASPPPGEMALVEGFSWHTDPAGFRVGAPDGWTFFRVGTTVCFRDPAGIGVLGVLAMPPAANPLSALQREEHRLLDAGALPGYDRVRLARIDYPSAGAEWEYAFDDRGRRHAAALYFPASTTRAYLVFWVTREPDWQVSREKYDLIRASFRPSSTGRPA
jgi:eukaryotic-like serine/threonine-protein kinase